MAPNVSNVHTNGAKKRWNNGDSKPASRRTTRSGSRVSQLTLLKDLQKEINATKALMDKEKDKEKQGELEVSLKQLLSSYEQVARNLAATESDIMEIDTDLNNIGQGVPMDVDDTDENSGEGPDKDQQNEIADQPEPEANSYGSSLSSTANPERKDLNDTTISHDSSASQQFVDQTARPSETQGASQQDHEKPKDYKDYPFVDLTLGDDDGPSERLFENGTVILKKNARSGVDYLNSYGPLNCAMTIWSSNAAPNKVEDCTYLKGSPHNQAELKDETGKALYKGMIRNIKKVAWQPRREGSTMLDLLESVEELNPEVKKRNTRYIFPFTTVLVDWKQGVNLPPVWISRTNYKKLSSTAKKEGLKTDRRIYAVALVQVKNYRNWAGKLLDNKWTGMQRIGLAQSPTPFPETLETEQILLRGQYDHVQDEKSENNQDQRTQGPSLGLGNSQNRGTRSESNEGEHSQAQSNAIKSAKNQGNAASPTDYQFSNENPVAHDKKPESSPQQTFNRKKFLNDILSMIDDFNTLQLEKQMEMRTLALAQYDLYKRKMEEGGAKEEPV